MSLCSNNNVITRSTKARLHDRMAWEEQMKLAHRDRFYVVPSEKDTYIPSASLLATTEARNSDARAWNNHIESISTAFTIKTNFAPVKEHVLRLTKARLQEICLLQEQRKLKELLKCPPPPRYLLSSFMPSSHLLSSTKARELDTLAWHTAKEQATWQFSAQVVMKLPPLSEHLLAPTLSQKAAMDAWQVEKANAPFADDIWWEKRRPTPCSDYHHKFAEQLPSKVTEVTVSFSLSMRQKFMEEQVLMIEEQTKMDIAISQSRRNMPKITQESHLLTTTKATMQCSWSAMINRRERIVDVRHLDLPSRVSYPAQKRITSKLYEDTMATRLHRWEEKPLLSRRKSIKQLVANDSAHRLLRPTRAVLLQQTACFSGHQQDAREKRWNVHTTRARAIKENPFEDEQWTQLGNKRRRHSRYANTPSKVFDAPSSRKMNKHDSWTSTEVRAVVAKAVTAALAEANKQNELKKTRKSTAKKQPVSSPVPTGTRSSVLRQQKQVAATLKSQTPVKKTASSSAAASKKSQVNKFDSVAETRAQSLQNKIDALMMLTANITPIKATPHPAAAPGAADTCVSLIFEDLSDCISPMSSVDELDDHHHHKNNSNLSRHQSHYAIVQPSHQAQQEHIIPDDMVELNLSAPTIDQLDHNTSHYRLSMETTKLSDTNETKQQQVEFVLDSNEKSQSFWKKQQDMQRQQDTFERALEVDCSDEDTVVMEVTPQPHLETTMLLA